jgi:hypothetical protein
VTAKCGCASRPSERAREAHTEEHTPVDEHVGVIHKPAHRERGVVGLLQGAHLLRELVFGGVEQNAKVIEQSAGRDKGICASEDENVEHVGGRERKYEGA